MADFHPQDIRGGAADDLDLDLDLSHYSSHHLHCQPGTTQPYDHARENVQGVVDVQVEAGEGNEEGQDEGGDPEFLWQVMEEEGSRRKGGGGVAGGKGVGRGGHVGDEGDDFRVRHKGPGFFYEILQDAVGDEEAQHQGREDGDAQGSCLLFEEQEQRRHHPDEAHVPQIRGEFENPREQGRPDGVLEEEKKEGLHMHKSVHGKDSFGKKELRVES